MARTFRKKSINKPLSAIHPLVRLHKILHVARILNCSISTVSRFLRKYLINGTPLSYRKLKKLTIDEARNCIKNYDTSLTSSSGTNIVDTNNNKFSLATYEVNFFGFDNLREWPFAQLHQFILTRTNQNPNLDIDHIACELGISCEVLNRCIARYIFENELLDFTTLKTLPPEAGNKIPNYYEKIKLQRINLNDYAFAYIHKKIIHSDSKFEASISLGVHHVTLDKYLLNYRFRDKRLTYKKFKKLTPQEAAQLWPKYYFISDPIGVKLLPSAPNATSSQSKKPCAETFHKEQELNSIVNTSEMKTSNNKLTVAQQLFYRTQAARSLTLFNRGPQINVGTTTIDLSTIEGSFKRKI